MSDRWQWKISTISLSLPIFVVCSFCQYSFRCMWKRSLIKRIVTIRDFFSTWSRIWQLKCNTLIHQARRVLKGKPQYFTICFVCPVEYALNLLCFSDDTEVCVDEKEILFADELCEDAERCRRSDIGTPTPQSPRPPSTGEISYTFSSMYRFLEYSYILLISWSK